MMRLTKRRTSALFAIVPAVALALMLAGCGQTEAEVLHDEEVDPHAGHACDGDHGETEAIVVDDDHEGRVEGEAEEDHDDDAVDPHAGHDHGAEEPGKPDEHEGEDGLVLSARDRADAGIAFAVAGPGHIEIHSRLLGEVRMNEERLAHVVPPVPGIVREVRVRVGDTVGAGQLLAVLASRELAETRATYLGARGRRELAQIDHDNQKNLWEQDILAEQDYLDARQALLEADIELQAAEQALHALGTTESELGHLEESHDAGAMTRLELRAPIAGTVTDMHMVLGEVVGEEEVLAIADLSTVWVDLDVPQTELSSVRAGQRVTVSASTVDLPDATGVVSFVSPLVDETTRTAYARVELPNHSGVWRPGLFVTASLASDHTEVPVMVEKDAIQLLDGEHVVFVADGDAFEPVLVATGRSDDEHIEILGGLKRGQEYVAEGAFALKAEMVTSGMDPHAGHGH